jgi:GxxExxY protein
MNQISTDQLNHISGLVVDSALRIHRRLGPGLMENVYETVMGRDLTRIGLRVERQVPISFDFEGMWFENACTADLVVERAVIVELKSVRVLAPVFSKQLLTYLRLLDLRLGLLLNFGSALMKDGIIRIVNRLEISAP